MPAHSLFFLQPACTQWIFCSNSSMSAAGENMCADLEKLAQDLNEMGLEDEAETIWDAMAPVRQFED